MRFYLIKKLNGPPLPLHQFTPSKLAATSHTTSASASHPFWNWHKFPRKKSRGKSRRFSVRQTQFYLEFCGARLMEPRLQNIVFGGGREIEHFVDPAFILFRIWSLILVVCSPEKFINPWDQTRGFTALTFPSIENHRRETTQRNSVSSPFTLVCSPEKFTNFCDQARGGFAVSKN